MDRPTGEQALGSLATDLAAASFAVARRFAAGATLWCWAPDRLEHAQHVAVEFVHPVIVGKRALDAVAIAASPADAPDALRPLVRHSDVLLAIGSAPEIAPVLRRAVAWGAATLWLGTGPRPPAGAADHVLWLGESDALAEHDGRLVLAYHLLWELTHVCFEHPGLLQEPAACEGPVCITCSDEGRLAEVVSPSDTGATVRTAGGIEEIDTTMVGEVGPGDLLLVHAGTALTIIEDGEEVIKGR